MSTTAMLDRLAAARRASTPLVAISTPDPASTVKIISERFNGETPILAWDIVRGLQGVNENGTAVVSQIAGDTPALTTTNPVEALETIGEMPVKSIVIFRNAHRIWENESVVQAIWNLRDSFKRNMRMLVMLAPSVRLPAELTQDTLVLEEPLPDADELTALVRRIVKDGVAAGITAPDERTLEMAVDAVVGLSAFAAEQALAMSLTKTGIDLDSLQERIRKTIEQVPGLSTWRGGETFKDIAGYDNVKQFLRLVLNGKEPPRVIVFIDEIEKAIGSGNDTSGVAQALLGMLLTWMQDRKATGVICIGPPGSGKSLVAKATGGEGNRPTIQLDFTAMKGSLVGQSEGNLRTALAVIDAVSQGRALFVATCNSISILPPELRRRFKFGTFYFDLPTAAERDLIWDLYCAQFGLEREAVNDEGWTGAEIQQCCDLAYRLQCGTRTAANYVVPVSVAAADQIKRLRNEANGRYINASAPGVYTIKAAPGEQVTRMVEL